ncbi:MAG: type I polyketide synthase, partial [Blastocatellia bacterium]
MANSSAASELNGSEIAIIGMACRFPGANDVESFWRKLSTGTELITFLKDDEIAVSAFEPGQANIPSYVKAAALIDGADLFDAAFFGFSPKEAEIIDPQQRIFLECCWEALETAGYDPERYEGLIGTFGGARTDTYLYNLVSNLGSTGAPTAFDLGLGNDLAFLTTRVSFKLNLRGPSYSVHTACSTSLVAVHLACQSLLIGECNMALAGGVAVNIPQRTGYRYEPGGILSPDGHCRSFDSKAAGTIFGSGAGVVLLKRFEDALAVGDHIDAVIKGTATNNDGAMKASFTAPSVQGQARVIADALAAGGVEAQSVSYIEAHGTGTALGDAVEIKALNHVFGGALGRYTCPVGAVKTNLGHLDAAAGMAGLIKTVLALQHGQLPPTLHFENPNPKIDFEGGPFFVNRTLVDWQVAKGPRRAGVSSFGIGGANAHVVLEQAPAREPSGPSREFRLLTLSARTESALEAASANLHRYLNDCQTADLADVAYTLQVGRKAFGHRRFVLASEAGEATGLLQQGGYLKTATGFTDVANRPVVMMFPGQGSQCANMAVDLYRTEVRFRAEIDRCSDLLSPILGVDLRNVLYAKDIPGAEAEVMLRETWLAQPAIFAVEVALARQWMQWGVEPDAMIGHSVGEFAAAHLAGVLTLEDALRLVALRGRMMQAMPPGAMVAVEVNEKKARAYLSDDLSLAAVNGAKQCVISGALAAVEALERELSKEGLNYKRLRTSHAFHSTMMDPIVDRFEAEVRKTKLNEPAIRYISNVTGTWITDSEATDSRYWGRHLRDTVM